MTKDLKAPGREFPGLLPVQANFRSASKAYSAETPEVRWQPASITKGALSPFFFT